MIIYIKNRHLMGIPDFDIAALVEMGRVFFFCPKDPNEPSLDRSEDWIAGEEIPSEKNRNGSGFHPGFQLDISGSLGLVIRILKESCHPGRLHPGWG